MEKKFEMHEIMPEQLKDRYDSVKKEYCEYGFQQAYSKLEFGGPSHDTGWGCTLRWNSDGGLEGMITIDLPPMELRQEDIQSLQVDLTNKLNEWIRNVKNRNIV